jgi:hypothetical protein
VAYASHQINKPEQAYSASEAELLAVVWAAKHFRCYLYGKPFKVRTDHAALTYLKKFSDTNAKVMRWSLKLSELDFEVEHRAGSKMPHVDALSRHVGTVVNQGSLDPEGVRAEQGRDPFCRKLEPGCYNSKNECYYDDTGLIYRRKKNEKHQLLVPRALINEVIRQNHYLIYAAHPRIRCTCELISLSFWWPAMRNAVEGFIKECDTCQMERGP